MTLNAAPKTGRRYVSSSNVLAGITDEMLAEITAAEKTVESTTNTIETQTESAIPPTAFKWPLGARARDMITGTVGIIVSRRECINGCNRYAIEWSSPVGAYEFDEERIELVTGENFIKMAAKKRAPQERAGPSSLIPNTRL